MSEFDVYRVSNKFTAPGSDGLMIFTAHFRTVTVNTVISDAQEAFEIATESVSTIESLYLPFVGDSITFEESTVIGITNPLIGVTVSSNTAGSLVEGLLSLRSAPVVKLQTGNRGRSYNGRMYLMAPTEQQQSGGVLGAQTVSDLTTFITGYRRFSTQPSTNVYDLTIYSKVLSGVGPPVDNLVNVWLTNDVLGSQRGRQTVT